MSGPEQSGGGALEPRAAAPLAAPTEAQRVVAEPPPRSFPLSFGWVVVLIASVLMAFSSWTIYGTQAAGMWAGYRDGLAFIVLALALAALRCDVPKSPFIGLTGLLGVLLILEGVFIGETFVIQFTEIAAGIAITVGSAIMMTAHDR